MTNSRSSREDAVRESFLGVLLFDVVDAIKRHDSEPTQSGKRNLIRTNFAALEGLSWLFREHVGEAARAMSELGVAEEVLLSETSYQVNDQGRITEQVRYLPLVATIRLTARIAGQLAPDVKVDFSGHDWEQFKEAIKVRNRVTHPKRTADLVLSDQEMQTSTRALYWLLEVTSQIMEATNLSFKTYVGQLREVLELLKAGDRETLEMYERATQLSADEH